MTQFDFVNICQNYESYFAIEYNTFIIFQIKEGSVLIEKEKAIELMGTMFSDRKDDLEVIIDECNSSNQAITEK